MLQKSTLQLLRFPFSYFLMPVYWFALSLVNTIYWPKAILIFCILNILVFPSGNGYNSYMDRDETSIGGLEKPMQPTRQLFYVTLVMDVLAFILALFISTFFAIGTLIYITCSRAYSYRGIRLKRLPVTGYLTVILNQGGLIFCMVYLGAGTNGTMPFPWIPAIAATLLIGGFYPITQVYQHEADAKDNVTTLSMLLGKRGTFLFCGLLYTIAFSLLMYYYQQQGHSLYFGILQLFFIPVILFFLRWWYQVWKDGNKANFTNVMRMNWIAATCSNLAFITLLILHLLG